MRTLISSSLCFLLLAGCSPSGPQGRHGVVPQERSRAAQPGLSPQSFHRTITVTKDVSANYLLYLPSDYGKEKKSWPLLMFLHGSGQRGDDLQTLKQAGIPRLIAEGKDFPFIIVSPQCPADDYWEPDILNALLDEVTADYDVDPDRVCLTGLSLGGYGSWRLAATHPERFAAVVPICGGGSPRWAPALASLPIWVFHGGKDKTVSIQESENMVMALREYGSSVRFTVFPDAAHDSWTQAYATPELYDWLLAQKRKPLPAQPPSKVVPAAKPIELQLEDFKLEDADVVDLPGQPGKGVRFAKDTAAATFTIKLDPRGYEIAVYQCADDDAHNISRLTLNNKTYKLTLSKPGVVARAQGIDRVLIYNSADYTLRFNFPGSPGGVIVDRIVITPLY